MNIQINYTKHDFDTIRNTTTYMFRAIADGKQIVEDITTFDNNGSFHKNIPAYFTNFYSKWAYRTHKIENAVVTVNEGKWWD